MSFDKIIHLNTSTKVEWKLWTPIEAKKYIDKTKYKRKIVKDNVNKIIKDMKDGRFVTNGETIIISDSGEVLDGNHRLLACIQSGVSFCALTVRGMNSEYLPYMDRGSSRTPSHILQIQNLPGRAQVLRQRYLLDRCWHNKVQFSSNNIKSLTEHELISLAVNKGEESDLCLKLINNKVPGNNCRPGAQFAALYLALRERNKKIADDFFYALVAGRGIDTMDKTCPIVYLRERLAAAADRNVTKSNEMSTIDKVWVTIKTFNKWYRNEKIKKVMGLRDLLHLIIFRIFAYRINIFNKWAPI